jgi:GntR family transcriptional regulator
MKKPAAKAAARRPAPVRTSARTSVGPSIAASRGASRPAAVPSSSARAPSGAAATPRSQAGAARTPLYRQVLDTLRGDILKGVFPVGSQLPAEEALAARFQVSRNTVREALRHLRDRGLIASRQGAGTTVSGLGAAHGYVQEIDSITDLIQYAASIRYRVDRSELIAADAPLVSQIGGSVGQKWLRIEGLRYADGDAVPLCRTVVYVHADYAGVGRLVGRRKSAIYELIEDLYAEKIGEVEQTFCAYAASADIAKELQVEAGTVVVEVKRTYRTVSKKIAEVAVNQFPFDRFTFAMRLRRAP